jgi:hypothetical protein
LTQIPSPALEAIQNLTGRMPVTKDVFLSLPDEARMRAFTIARQSEIGILQNTLDALNKHLADGGTMWNFREKFPDIVKPYTEAGREWHLRLVVEQNLRQAQAVGAYAQRQRVKAAFPFVEYQAGPNPRPTHAALDGKIFALDDPFLLAHTPPWEHGCNCDLISRTAAQVGRVRAADQDKGLAEQRVVPGNAKLESLAAQNKMPSRSGGGALYPVDVRPPSMLPPDQGDDYSFRPDRLNQDINLAAYPEDFRQRLAAELEKLGYSVQGGTAVAGPWPGSTPPTAFKSRVGRPLVRLVAFKAAGTAAEPGQMGSERSGRPLGRVGAQAPQIARVGPAHSRRVA